MGYDDLTKRIDDIVVSLKHGKHDQSSHGRKRGGGSGGGGSRSGGSTSAAAPAKVVDQPPAPAPTATAPSGAAKKPRKVATPEELERRAMTREANKIRLADNPVEAMYNVRDVDQVIELVQWYRKAGDNKMAEIALNAFRDNFFDGDIDEADDYISSL